MQFRGTLFISMFALCVSVLWVVAAVANYRFGILQGTPEPISIIFGISTTSSQINGIASIAVDGFKALLTVVITVSYRYRAYVLLLISTIIFVGCVAWSAQSAFGYILTERSGSLDSRAQAADQWSALKKDLDEAEKRRGMIPVHRPANIIISEIEVLKISRLWQLTGQCHSASATSRREEIFCQEYKSLSVEHASAIAASELDSRIESLRHLLDSKRRISSTDPVAAALGIDMGSIRGSLFALLVEMISGFGLWILWTTHSLIEEHPTAPQRRTAAKRKTRRVNDIAAAPAAPETNVVRLAPQRGGTTTLGAALAPQDIEEMVRRCGSQRAAAKSLGIDERTLRRLKNKSSAATK